MNEKSKEESRDQTVPPVTKSPSDYVTRHDGHCLCYGRRHLWYSSPVAGSPAKEVVGPETYSVMGLARRQARVPPCTPLRGYGTLRSCVIYGTTLMEQLNIVYNFLLESYGRLPERMRIVIPYVVGFVVGFAL